LHFWVGSFCGILHNTGSSKVSFPSKVVAASDTIALITSIIIIILATIAASTIFQYQSHYGCCVQDGHVTTEAEQQRIAEQIT
jgi:hypothetical protein